MYYQMSNMMNYSFYFIMLLFFVISTIGIGYYVVIKYLLGFNSKIILSFFIGEIIYSFLWIIISSYLSRPYNVLTFLPLLVFFFFRGLRVIFTIQVPKIPLKLSLDYLYSFIIGALLVFYSLLTFVRPYEWDHIAYRFPAMTEISKGNISFPLLSSNEYSIFFKPFVAFFGNLPYASESYSSILYSITNFDIASQQLYLVNLVLFLVFIATSLKIKFRLSNEASLLVCLLILLSYGNTILIGTGLIDLNMMIYQFLALYSALMFPTRKGYIFLFAFFATYSVAHKYTSLYVIFPMVLYIMYRTNFIDNKNSINIIIHDLLKLTIIVFISGGFWYLKNIYIYGNPIYPLYLGHIGLDNQTYEILMDNLIYGLRSGRDVFNLIKVLFVNYKSEYGVIIMSIIVALGYILKRKNLSKDNSFILLLCVFIYLINFYLGSQVSRFILIVPTLIYILGAQVVSSNRLFMIVVTCILLIGIKTDPLQWSVWSARMNIVKLLLVGNEAQISNIYLGCLNNVSIFLSKNDAYAYNLWDPYATSFYQTNSRFVTVPNLDNLSIFKNNNVSYLYINLQYKNSFDGNRYIHRDMYIEERLNFEKNILEISHLEFKDKNCELYKIN